MQSKDYVPDYTDLVFTTFVDYLRSTLKSPPKTITDLKDNTINAKYFASLHWLARLIALHLLITTFPSTTKLQALAWQTNGGQKVAIQIFKLLVKQNLDQVTITELLRDLLSSYTAENSLW